MDNRITGAIRGVSPCTGCNERFLACHDHCPKDGRGEYGYAHWKADIQILNDKRRSYADERNKIYEEEQRRKKWGGRTF